MNSILTIARKDLLLLWRDKFGLFWILIFPLMFALFFGAIFSGDSSSGSMTIAIVDLDQSDASETLAEKIEASNAIRAASSPAGAWTVETARAAVARGAIVAYVAIPEGYGDGGAFFFVNDAPQLEVGIDPSRTAERGFLQGILTEASFSRFAESFSNPASLRPDVQSLMGDLDADEDIPAVQRAILSTFFNALDTFLEDLDVESTSDDNDEDSDGPTFDPIQLEITDVMREGIEPPSAFAISFPQATAWGIIGAVAGFAISLVQERTRGTLMRLRTAPLTHMHILAGKGLACFVTCVVVTLLLVAFAWVVFGVVPVNLPGLLIAAAASGFCFTGIMMFISTLGTTEQGVAGAGWAAMMPMAMLGGGMIPLFIMPDWMRSLSHVSPVKWAILSLEGAIWRGFTLADLAVPVLVLCGVGTAGLLAGVAVLSRRDA